MCLSHDCMPQYKVGHDGADEICLVCSYILWPICLLHDLSFSDAFRNHRNAVKSERVCTSSHACVNVFVTSHDSMMNVTARLEKKSDWPADQVYSTFTLLCASMSCQRSLLGQKSPLLGQGTSPRVRH